MKFLRLYRDFAVVSIRMALAHRSAFWAGFFGQWLGYGTTFLGLYLLVMSFDTLGGWNASQVLFMYAFNLLSYALAATFFFNPMRTLPEKIRTGEFDSALTKPVNPFLHEIYQGFNFGYVSHITLSAVVMAVSLRNVGVPFSLGSALLFLVMLLGASLIQAALLIASSSASFVTIGHNPLSYFFWDIKTFINYPISIYHASIQIVLTVILPMAFINFFPSSIILGMDSGSIFPYYVGYLTPLVGALLFWISIRLWYWGLSKYQSSGS